MHVNGGTITFTGILVITFLVGVDLKWDKFNQWYWYSMGGGKRGGKWNWNLGRLMVYQKQSR